MIIEAESGDFRNLIAGEGPRDLGLPDSELAPQETLEMLSGLAGKVRSEFSPAAWLIVEHHEVVGLCSVIRAPSLEGIVEIGYGVAPTRRRRGVAGRAVAEVIKWAKADARVCALAAETSPMNAFSQRVLELNGFHKIGERVDLEDGHLFCW